jgi:hypothetical protein
MEALDSDKDDMISRQEWTDVVKKLFDASEKDKEMRVDAKAIAAALNGMFTKPPDGKPGAGKPGAGKPGAGPPGFGLGFFMAGPIVKRADADKDGKLTLDEMLTAAAKLFDEFDTAKSGKLDDTAFSAMLNALFPTPNLGPPAGKGGEPKKDEKKEKS